MKSLRHTLTLLIASGIIAATLMTAFWLWSDQRSSDAVDRALVAKDVPRPPRHRLAVGGGTGQVPQLGLATPRGERSAAGEEELTVRTERQLPGCLLQHDFAQQFAGRK